MSIPFDNQTSALPSESDQRSTRETQPPPTAANRKPFRLWPGVAAAVLLLLGRYIVPSFIPEAILYGLMVGMFGIAAIVVWWVLFSRAPWIERLGAIVLMVVGVVATSRIIHISISNGSMGYLFYVLIIPILCLALVAWAVASHRLSTKLRRLSLAIVILLTCGAFTLIRTGGLTATFDNDFHWRWSKTPEERLLAQAEEEAAALASAPAATSSTSLAAKTSDWPGFRGGNRDGIVHGVRIATDWTTSPPAEIWRRPIGPGWSSFAVQGDRIYTQEQRGPDEVVSCYNVNTGKPIWKHGDAARFWESNGGAGPRGTPTLSNGRVYTLGATGILNVLKAEDGSVVWTRNAVSDTKAKLPIWGFSGSPLVVGDIVVVATAGTMAAYDLASGQLRWIGPNGGGGYSSPQLFTISGVPQILLLSAIGATSVTPTDGKVLWQHPLTTNARIVQPAMTAEGDVLVHEGEGNEMRRLAVANGPAGWTISERWNSFSVNPYFNDFVVHKGHAFGFNGSSIACMDLKDGANRWKGGHYGQGQLVLLADQDMLVVLAETGEVALVGATTDQYKEFARIPAIKGKTWNHPVVAGDVLLVRNAEEMVAFKLAPAR
ncbi:MAG TPA: PQQ-binding-like beta-propeller repeat protein [Pyrinomonadaceae bacterium]|nr:PQQ-binding-like beta-propeller repeat protein [Pyrinomonadaceae bacterium]